MDPLELVSVDPGKSVCGVAEWRRGVLVGARLAPSLTFVPPCRSLWVVCEKMEDRRQVPSKDLFDVAIHGALLSGRYLAPGGTFEAITAGRWKGSRPKAVHTRYIKTRVLYPEELATIEASLRGVPADLHHNVWDAAGIGLWALERA